METNTIIYIVSLLIVIAINIITDKIKAKNYKKAITALKNYSEDRAKEHYNLGLTDGRDMQKSKSWSHFVFSNTKDGLKVFINGKEVKVSQTHSCTTIGFWHRDGHTYRGFGSPDEFNEENAQTMYGRDFAKIQKEFDLKSPEEDSTV